MKIDPEVARSYLRKIAPAGSAEESVGGAEAVLEALKPSQPVPQHLEEPTKRALEKTVNNQPMAPDEQFALEAIIIPDKRPAVRIINGSYTIDHPLWTHYQTDAAIRGRITAAIPSVGRIDLPNHPSLPFGGTAFVVGDGVLMTNRHVAEIFTSGLGTKQLRFQSSLGTAIDFKREDPNATATLLGVRGVMMIHPYWDMALLRVDGLSDAHKPIKLSLLDPDQLKDREVAVIGYPAFDPRNDVAVQNQVFGGVYNVKRLQPGLAGNRSSTVSFGKSVSALTHDSSTLGGNSGSIVLDVQTGNAIALHFGGIYLKSNYGVPAAELGRDPRVVDAGVQFQPEAHPATTTPWDKWWSDADEEEAPAMTKQPVSQPAVPQASAAAAAKGSVRAATVDGVATWTIPIEISVRIGGAGRAEAVEAPPITEAMVMPFHEDDLSDRDGFDKSFLGVSVSLPKVKQSSAAAPVQGGGTVLKYHHFSVVMHKKRRIALFTASNIDKSKKLREPEPGEDYTRKGLTGLGPNDQEKWFPDPRIAAIHQLPDRFFTKDKGAFDKGHIVRREDVAWGRTYAEVRAANGDTYHTTNCSPQIAGFNRSASGDENWGDLENYVLKQAKTERLSLFAGPVLADDDPFFVGVDDEGPLRIQIPGRFWKVVVAATDGELQSYGFILEQDLSGTPLEFVVDAVWQQHMIPITDLQDLLGITFPKAVRDADQSSTQNGESVRESANIGVSAKT